jgi:hypothetical protein
MVVIVRSVVYATTVGSGVNTKPAPKLITSVRSPSRMPEFVTGPDTVAVRGSKVPTLFPLIVLQLLFGDADDDAAFPWTPKKFLTDCAEVDCSKCDKLKLRVTVASIVAILIFAFMIISPFFDSDVGNGFKPSSGRQD